MCPGEGPGGGTLPSRVWTASTALIPSSRISTNPETPCEIKEANRLPCSDGHSLAGARLASSSTRAGGSLFYSSFSGLGAEAVFCIRPSS